MSSTTISTIIPAAAPKVPARPTPDAALIAAVAEKSARVMARLNTIIDRYPNVVFANSLGAEDMVLVDLIFKVMLILGFFLFYTGSL